MAPQLFIHTWYLRLNMILILVYDLELKCIVQANQLGICQLHASGTNNQLFMQNFMIDQIMSPLSY